MIKKLKIKIQFLKNFNKYSLIIKIFEIYKKYFKFWCIQHYWEIYSNFKFYYNYSSIIYINLLKNKYQPYLI